MKTLEINIGLNSKEFGVIHHETALNKLRIQGFQIIAYRLQESTCDDGDETCLAARVGLPEDWQGGLASLADKLGQDCIAIAGFAGARPYASFDASLWVSVDEDRHVENLARKTEFPWDHSDLVGICKWEAAKIRKARFDKQIGGGKFNA